VFVDFIPHFGATRPHCLFRRTNVNETRQIFGSAQSFDRQHEITREAGEISTADFLNRDRPSLTLDNDPAAAQSWCVGREAELERMKAERDDPVARKRSEIFAVGAKRDIALVIDENFGARGWNGTP